MWTYLNKSYIIANEIVSKLYDALTIFVGNDRINGLGFEESYWTTFKGRPKSIHTNTIKRDNITISTIK